jgi:glycoprotein endo-alpha-1,2-mannosidase
MRRGGRGLLAAVVGTTAVAVWFALPAGAGASVSIFYYPWYGTPNADGSYRHWQQNGRTPPARIAASYYPARGIYSSSDRLVLAAQMAEIAAAGVDEVVTSWWGRGSAEDDRLRAVIAAARAEGLRPAAHIEPYGDRTVASVGTDIAYLRALGTTAFYVYASTALPDEEWAVLNKALTRVRVFAQTGSARKAAAGRFDGLYTYDVLGYRPASFWLACEGARRLGLLCAPSVGPGFDARRATGEPRVKPRRHGRTYDAMWRGAIRARADIVTITSYNEWHEGTQIEPARARAGYRSYEGDYGLTGRAAESAYLWRTAYWAELFRFRAG